MFWSSHFRRGPLVLGRWETPSFPALPWLYVLIKCVVEVPSFLLRRLSWSQIALEWMYYFKDNFLEPLLSKLSFSWKFLYCSRATVFVEHPDSGLSCSTRAAVCDESTRNQSYPALRSFKDSISRSLTSPFHRHGSDKLSVLRRIP